MIDPRINFEEFNRRCAYCDLQTTLSIEHVIPESKGGATGLANCVPACRRCNFAKSNKHPGEWFRRQQFFKEERWQKILSVLNINEQYIDLFFSEKKSEYPKFVCKLPELMRTRQLDQKTLAAQTGLSPTTVGKLYRNHFDRIDNHTITTLCKYFGLQKLDDLIELVWEIDDVEGVQV